MCPKRSSARRASTRIALSSRTSAGTASASLPRARQCSTTLASGASRRAHTTTDAPSRAKATAVARPMPLEAPVITTTDSDRSRRMTHLRGGSEQARCQPLLAMLRHADYAASMPAAKPATTLVLLVRHGVTPTTGRLLPGRRRGLHLSDEGRRQAETLAARLAVVPKHTPIYS